MKNDQQNEAAARTPGGEYTHEDLLDRERLADLELLSSDEEPDVLNELIEVYADETTAQLIVLGDAVQSSDFGAIARIAHRLKGSSRTLGAKIVADVCEAIEKNAFTQEQQEEEMLMIRLKNEFEATKIALRNYAQEIQLSHSNSSR